MFAVPKLFIHLAIRLEVTKLIFYVFSLPLTCKNKESLDSAIDLIQRFHNVSSLKLNKNKTIFYLGNTNHRPNESIHFKCFGIDVCINNCSWQTLKINLLNLNRSWIYGHNGILSLRVRLLWLEVWPSHNFYTHHLWCMCQIPSSIK